MCNSSAIICCNFNSIYLLNKRDEQVSQTILSYNPVSLVLLWNSHFFVFSFPTIYLNQLPSFHPKRCNFFMLSFFPSSLCSLVQLSRKAFKHSLDSTKSMRLKHVLKCLLNWGPDLHHKSITRTEAHHWQLSPTSSLTFCCLQNLERFLPPAAPPSWEGTNQTLQLFFHF